MVVKSVMIYLMMSIWNSRTTRYGGWVVVVVFLDKVWYKVHHNLQHEYVTCTTKHNNIIITMPTICKCNCIKLKYYKTTIINVSFILWCILSGAQFVVPATKTNMFLNTWNRHWWKLDPAFASRYDRYLSRADPPYRLPSAKKIRKCVHLLTAKTVYLTCGPQL